MQDNRNEWQPNQDETQRNDGPKQTQVPSSLLSNILRHLELSPEQTPPELSLDDLLLKLRSTTWQDRTLALHSLEKLNIPISIHLLSPFLQDEDATVRATTVHLLGTMSTQLPLHWLIIALHDTNWHVREAAVFALAKQGSRIPREVLTAVLHDKDGSVREAASFVLHQNSIDKNSSAFYGQLREEIPMQHEHHDPARLNGKHSSHSGKTAPTDDWNGTFMEYSGNSVHPHIMSEQAQAYAAGQYTPHNATSHETPPDEYAEIMPSRNEKVTSYRLRRKSHKGWWAIIVVIALLFLGLGRLSATMFVPQMNFGSSLKDTHIVVPDNAKGFPFDGPAYALIMQNSLSVALHLTPQQLMSQLKQRGNIAAIATAQGISGSQLQVAEMNAFNTIFNQAVKTGDIDSQAASNWMKQLQNNSEVRDKIVLTLLNIAPAP